MGRVAIAVVLALSLCMVMTVPVSAATIGDVSATPVNDMAGAITTYPVGFTTVTPYVIDSVEIEFAAGFDVSGATLGTVTGIGAGTIGVSGQVVTYSVTAPAHLAAGAVAISLSGIVNAAAATYDPGVTVRTKSGVATIDSGSVAVEIVSAPVSFLVVTQGAGTQTAGTAFSVTVTARAEAAGAGADVTGYTGAHLIDFSSTASAPKTIPAFAVITFTDGVGTSLTEFVLNVVETGKTITATDSEISVTGTSEAITVNPGAADYLTITGAPAAVTAGVAFSTDVIVTAYDASGNVATGDTQTVHWTSSDGTATAGTGLPADHALVLGTWTFLKADFILKTVGAVAGAQTITATESAGTLLSAPATVTVNPAAASTLTVASVPTSIAADGVVSSTITATAYDAFDNVDTNYTASVTFATSLGTLSGVSANFVSGVATATLTSTTTGTATVLVASGTLTDVTTTVTLTAAGIEVWVDDTGNDNNPGTETLPFETIAAGITAAGAAGTVNVLPGTYAPTSTLTIAADGLTLQSTGTALETIIDTTTTDVVAISITGDDVKVDGFSIKTDGNRMGISIEGGDAIVQDNTITLVGTEAVGIGSRIAATNTTISGNTVVNATIYLEGEGNTVSGNSGGTINISTTSSDNVITGNTLTDIVSRGIVFNPEAGTHDNNLIEGNILSRNTNYGIHVEDDGDGTIVTNLTITGNTITDNGIAGILIDSNVVWGTGNTINNNNITGNLGLGIDNDLDPAVVINAENNWWGDDSGPYHVTTNNTASGDAVSDNVDYRPWLAAPYTMPAAPATSASISLVTGWNLISLPIIPTSSAITDVLAGLITAETVDWVDTFVYENGLLVEKKWDPPAILQNTLMSAGQGYWVNMTAGDTLTISGLELPAPPNVPPTYQVYEGWNLIGVKSVNLIPVAQYLGGVVTATIEVIYSYDATNEVYELVLSGGNFVPGHGYWLAVSANGTIYP